MKKLFTPNLIGAIMSVGIGVYILSLNGVFNPIPYGQVNILEVEEKNGRIYFKANFVKIKCKFHLLRVQTKYFGEWDEKPYIEENHNTVADRMQGEETIYISFVGSSKTVDEMQIKTRHLCPDGPEDNPKAVKVDGIFAKFSLSDYLTD